MNEPSDQAPEQERRRHRRVSKHFVLTYFAKDRPEDKYELTQLKNISLGGMCFVTSRLFKPGTILTVEMKTPFIPEKVPYEGEVVGCVEKLPNTLYETHIQFLELNHQAQLLLKRLLEIFEKE